MQLQSSGGATAQVQTKDDKGCKPPLDISEDSLHYQLGEFSRNFGIENWNNAMKINAELNK